MSSKRLFSFCRIICCQKDLSLLDDKFLISVCKLGEAVAVDVPADASVGVVAVPLLKLLKEFVPVAEDGLAVRMPCSINSLSRVDKCFCDVVLEGIEFLFVLAFLSSLVGDPQLVEFLKCLDNLFIVAVFNKIFINKIVLAFAVFVAPHLKIGAQTVGFRQVHVGSDCSLAEVLVGLIDVEDRSSFSVLSLLDDGVKEFLLEEDKVAAFIGVRLGVRQVLHVVGGFVFNVCVHFF